MGTDDPDTIAMTELVGGYPSKKLQPLCEIEPQFVGIDFIRCYPFMLQQAAARQQSNLAFAKAHLIKAYKDKDPDVRRILKETNCNKIVYKGSSDESRFPALQAILVPLIQKNLASDENIKLLFGEVSHVRQLLLEWGAQVADPPPANSPAGEIFAQYRYDPEVKATPASKLCAECGLVSDERCKKCTPCNTVSYCSVDCQRKHWPVHEPDCLRAQGKAVPKKVAAKAKRKKEENKELERIRNEKEREEGATQFMKDFTAFANESCRLNDFWARDCNGKRLQIHVPIIHADEMIGVISKMYLELRKVQILSLVFFPEGISPDKHGHRGIQLVDPSNNAHIIALFERLFVVRQGKGVPVGLHIGGVFVVNKVVRGKAASYAPDDNRLHKLVKYLYLAKEKLKPVPDTVDLGIDNSEDPSLSFTSTAFGPHCSIST